MTTTVINKTFPTSSHYEHTAYEEEQVGEEQALDTRSTSAVAAASSANRRVLHFHWPRLFQHLAWIVQYRRWLARQAKQGQVWCYRLEGETEWMAFEGKNQRALWQAYAYHPQLEVPLRDRHAPQVMRVLLLERLAFATDPEWPQPVVYEIDLVDRSCWEQQKGKDTKGKRRSSKDSDSTLVMWWRK
ncbi:hypothetical protein BCR43DRAFT_484308 [Syncephalastrum racemosum]|uniref:Uncharacterized protein n=1 Tax=Syncephalastrum racemosum TaxID=13706 RepID=A0A1X2HWJ7_SYNRA|nr:hypothetical protein BCR43DRAFT_484308 [Syncephalastrum racemosum]